MPTPECVARVLALFAELFPNANITERTGDAWLFALDGHEDASVMAAARLVAREPGRRFMPTVGELLGAMRGPAAIYDVDDIARRIESLGTYNPRTGWQWPSVEHVWRTLGAGIAEAYGAVDARLGAEGTGRDIALREFGVMLSKAVARDGPRALAAPAFPELVSGRGTVAARVIEDTARQLALPPSSTQIGER